MKKVIAAILAGLYLFTFAGATVSLHYCMDKLTEKSSDDNLIMLCNTCKTKTDQQKNNCCKTETKLVKIESDHYLPDFSFETIHFFSGNLPVAFIEVPSEFGISVNSERDPFPQNTLRSSQTSIYKLNGVFRI